MSEKLSDNNFKDLKKYSTKAFKEFDSNSYKQKLVYKLLSLIKVNNQNEFFNVLLRTLNSKDTDDVKELSRILKDIYPLNENFESVAYTIVMGIMTS